MFFITSYIIFNLLAYSKFRSYVNPISLFSLIHFFHNSSFYITSAFGFPVNWIAPTTLSDETLSMIFGINTLGYFFFCLTFLFVSKKTTNIKSFNAISKNRLISLRRIYNILLIASLIYYFNNYSGSYGSNQSLDSSGAFNPVKRIIDLRYYFAIIITIFSNKKSDYKYIFFELILSLIGGGRKALIILSASYFINNYLKNNFRIKSFTYLLFFPIVMSTSLYTLVFINITRSLDLSIFKKFSYTNDFFAENLSFILPQFLIFSNSEGVQNWTYQLINDGYLKLSYGLSYVQAILNIIILRPFQGEIANWQAAYKFKSVAYPNSTTHGWDFSFTAEAMLNWGNHAYISFIILALFLGLLYNNRFKNNYLYILYYSSFPLLIILFRSDSTSLFRAYSLLIFAYLITSITFKRKNENSY